MTVTSSSETGKLTGFDVVQSNYKTVGDHGIRADFLIPKVLPKGKRPIIVFFHGGCLVRHPLSCMLFQDEVLEQC